MNTCAVCNYPAGYHHPECPHTHCGEIEQAVHGCGPRNNNYNVLIFPPVKIGMAGTVYYHESSGYRAIQLATDAVGVGESETAAMLFMIRHPRFRRTPFSEICPDCSWPKGLHEENCPHQKCGEIGHALHGCGPVVSRPTLTDNDIGYFPPNPPTRTLWLAYQFTTRAWGTGRSPEQAGAELRRHAGFRLPKGLK